MPNKSAGICEHTHIYVCACVCNILDCFCLWYQLGIAELVKRINAKRRIGVLIYRIAGKRAYKAFYSPWKNIKCIFLTSELSFENEMPLQFLMQRKGDLGEKRE